MAKPAWMVSLHGGHSGEFCEHAQDTLRAMLDKAVELGFGVYGVAEHAPRSRPEFLFAEEVDKGYDVARLEAEFEAYATTVRDLAEAFRGRLTVLRAFEIEVVPADGYGTIMRGHRERFGFQYTVGSVHHVDDISIDSTQEDFKRAASRAGGPEPLAVRYYETVAEMVDTIQPEVVAHLDVIRKLGAAYAPMDTPKIRDAAVAALEAIAETGAILDVNTGALRRGSDVPYPAPWLVHLAHDMGIPFCFGDDSHSVAQVGMGIPEARDYLLDNGVEEITVLAQGEDGLQKNSVSLLEE